MKERLMAADCLECESRYEIAFIEAEASNDVPEYCPFCGERIEEIVEEESTDDESYDDEESWD